jgi:hypothetical protein
MMLKLKVECAPVERQYPVAILTLVMKEVVTAILLSQALVMSHLNPPVTTLCPSLLSAQLWLTVKKVVVAIIVCNFGSIKLTRCSLI